MTSPPNMEKTFVLRSREAEISGFRTQLGPLLDEFGLGRDELNDVVLAVDEALTNTMEHGYGDEQGNIEVRVQDLGDSVEIRIRDYGKPFDPTDLPAPKLPPTRVGGLGVHFIKSTVDKMTYCRSPDEANELCLTKIKKRPGDHPTAGGE